jgi:hypothetical protein
MPWQLTGLRNSILKDAAALQQFDSGEEEEDEIDDSTVGESDPDVSF